MLYVSEGAQGAQEAAEILLRAKETRSLARHEYDFLVKSLLKAGRREDARRIFNEFVALGRDRHRDLKRTQLDIALLAIALNVPDVAIEFSGRSGSVWLQQYVAVLYRTGSIIESDALSDRRSQRADIVAVRIGLLDYKSPLEHAINGQSRRPHSDPCDDAAILLDFYSQDRFMCDQSLKEVFHFLADSWKPQERTSAAKSVEVVIVDRDCVRPDGRYLVAFFSAGSESSQTISR